MKNDKMRANVLGVRVISNVSPELAAKLELGPNHKSIGIITADSDDVTYTALDEATKDADVEVVYARSMYAGAGNASTKLAGEVIGIIGGPSPAEVRSGLKAALDFFQSDDACFISANEDDSIVYYAHTVSRTGSYLSKVAGIEEGKPLAYLIAPPMEAIYGLDAAMKAADVKLVEFFGPPSETNFGGGLLTGTQSACYAACAAFAEAIKAVADNPRDY
ncbi:MAG: ethanolamine utilization microcompartment protein EutL [Candidatus Cellulosilyticum pullistercoris]|uniref:Ethanolamine utilization microcompartment protein EutL n=1 Tax=Candidatus Cellulosilyticum pullistercoris TaxID=2838521 RepID=A0A9E2NKT7_9FIRM|nr:ethanolamine utilization microcompartment protein EutL [Candidatus Cellulosilyticum pullistercoris]